MPEKKYDPSQWPPSPEFDTSISRDSGDRQEQARLLTGAIWADALVGGFISLISFTLLTFVLFNPIAASFLPEKLASQFRLLVGWFMAVEAQSIGWILFRRRNYHYISLSMRWISVVTGLFWLLIILALWWLFG